MGERREERDGRNWGGEKVKRKPEMGEAEEGGKAKEKYERDGEEDRMFLYGKRR